MKICYIYLQVRISSGYPDPTSLQFEAPYLKNPENFEFKPEEKATEANKRRKAKKSCKAKSIDTTKLNSEERGEILHRIKGRRNNRELVFESFHFCNKGDMEKGCSTKQELSFMCDEAESPCTDIVNTFLIPHLPPASSQAPTPSKPQSFPPEADQQEAAGGSVSLLDGAVQHHRSSITYFSGNPAVVITRGIIQVFKSNNKVTIGDSKLPQTDTLLMLAIPASVNAHGVIEFAQPFCDAIIRMQIIRDRTPNQYMVLLKFVSSEAAYNCYLTLNNKPYRSDLPDEICHLVFVASVEVLPAIGQQKQVAELKVVEEPPAHTTELPDCMVCLERMDESVRGVLTILCNHSFHAACLQQWEDLCCPVCRYIQTPEPYTHNKCQTCGALEDLWICLICGNVGCGRYTSEHAQSHYAQTYHNFAMSLNDDRVWDYVGDYFVHRLHQKDDGKLVEKKDGGSKDENRDNKLFDIQLECMHLLSTQLDSQRKYWEERLAEVEAKQTAGHQQLLDKHQETIEKHQQLESKVDALTKEKKNLSLRNTQLGAKFRDALKDLSLERELNKGIMENQMAWKGKVEKLEKEKTESGKEMVELKEQLRDLMFYIQGSRLIEGEDNKDEIREGKIVVGEKPTTSKHNRHNRKKK